ncbi:hypothetical protein XAP6984_80003 [Xanthomonas phaseoli pv. phaseoli]|uniref:Uncharacterized protein n=2 Tax=Xanthomonas TaxID=338 RepID=A0ABY1TWY4_XANCH|nr:hypothetical protein XAP6984_80003 [Xanthomonas phaseoli pv. phaseoli]
MGGGITTHLGDINNPQGADDRIRRLHSAKNTDERKCRRADGLHAHRQVLILLPTIFLLSTSLSCRIEYSL